MKRQSEAELTNESGLFLGSEPLTNLHQRHAATKDDDDSGKDGVLGGDDDSTDGDGTDTDTDGTDTGDTDTRDADGKD